MKKQIVAFCILTVLALSAFGCGKSIMIPTQRISAIPTDHAVVTFIRATRYGGAIDFGVWDGDQLVGVLDPKAYIEYRAVPGKHVFVARAENWSYVEANLEAGRRYYVLANVFPGVWKARVALRPIKQNDPDYNQDNIIEWVNGFRPMTPDPKRGDAYRQPRIGQVQSAVAEYEGGRVEFAVLEAQDWIALPGDVLASPPVAVPAVVSASPSGGCTRDIDCSGDLICAQGVCSAQAQEGAAPPPAPVASTGGCTKDIECSGDLVCMHGVCSAPAAPAPSPAPAPPAGGCAKDVDCQGDLICVDRVCTAPAKPTPPPVKAPPKSQCTRDIECKGNRICEKGVCKNP